MVLFLFIKVPISIKLKALELYISIYFSDSSGANLIAKVKLLCESLIAIFVSGINVISFRISQWKLEPKPIDSPEPLYAILGFKLKVNFSEKEYELILSPKKYPFLVSAKTLPKLPLKALVNNAPLSCENIIALPPPLKNSSPGVE